MAQQDAKRVVTNALDSITKDLPAVIKENKLAAVGLVLGYFLADAVNENDSLVPALLGGLIGHVIDEKAKK